MMFHTRSIIAMLALAAFFAAAANARAGQPRMAFTPLVTYSSFPADFAFTPAFGFGAELSYRISNGFQILLSASTTSSSRSYDAIGAVRSVPVQVVQAALMAEAQIAEVEGILRFSLLGGGGVMQLSSSEQRVALGALGDAVVPGSSSVHPLASFGAALTGPVLPGLALRIEPRLNAVGDNGSIRTGMSINAGVSLGLF
jgi:hypothetical protein